MSFSSQQDFCPFYKFALNKMEEEGAGQIGDWDDFAIQRSWNSAVAEYEVRQSHSSVRIAELTVV